MSQIKIERWRGSPGEGELLLRFNALMKELSPSLPDVTHETFQEVASGEQNRVFVARDEDLNLVGTATLIVYRKFAGLSAIVEDVVVASTHRQQGIGKRLMEEVIRKARNQGLKYLNLTSHPSRIPAHKLYKSLGFEEGKTGYFSLVL